MTKKKSAASPEPTPNEWCPVSGLPAFMYKPVPAGAVDETLLERHMDHWFEGDFDEERQAGFWMYTAYTRALPGEYRYLADRIMNLTLAFPDGYDDEMRKTIRGILVTAKAGFDWEPYFARKLGEQKLV